MKVIAHGSHIVLKLIPKKKEEHKIGSLIVPGSDNDDTNLYVVITVGAECPSIVGCKVFVKAYAFPIKIDGETFYIVDEKDIAAVIYD